MKILIKLAALVAVAFCLFQLVNSQTSKNARSGQQSLSDKVQQLLDMNTKRPVLRFNGNKFRDFVKSAPRNYSVIVMFTAMAPARQCVICRHAHDEYTIVANSYRYSQTYSNKLFFAMVDFDEGSDVFQMLRLNTAPVFIHFPPKGKPKPADTMDIQRVGVSAEVIGKWIQERTDIQIRIFRPPNYSATVAVLMLSLFVGGFLYLRRNNLDFLYNKQMWALLAVIFCFAMVSGQMWNHIRSPPFVHKSQNGGIAYIHGSSQGQLVIETYIVMFLSKYTSDQALCLNQCGNKHFFADAMIVLGMVLLTEAGWQNDNRKSKVTAIVGLFLVVIFFSLILSIFRSKAQGYPYSFLFK
ncbi:tumor suppressor candidate 3 isoform X1 [Anopheles cruzii]|uniref:tumor suppressor candidate 3 isoform X1 n=1 Tax=Anopheles cruzii TaxID=68878 RepID=UPI0022EC6A20|nr:tumor suppressor candidate 3 isoform X1 [Anopheles cruzii]